MYKYRTYYQQIKSYRQLRVYIKKKPWGDEQQDKLKAWKG